MTERMAYSVLNFAKAYDIGKTLAYELVNRGEVESRKVRGKTRIPRESAEAWFARQPAHTPIHTSSADVVGKQRTTAEGKMRKPKAAQGVLRTLANSSGE